MQIVSEVAEIVASAIDCVLVLWFLTSHFGKKKTIEWWKYAVWFVILFIPSHFMGEMFNLQSIAVILIVISFSMIYLQGKINCISDPVYHVGICKYYGHTADFRVEQKSYGSAHLREWYS